MASKDERNLWTAVAAGSALVAGLATRKAVAASWTALHEEPPPHNPYSAETGWRDAIFWTVGVSVAVGLSRLVTRRVVAGLVADSPRAYARARRETGRG